MNERWLGLSLFLCVSLALVGCGRQIGTQMSPVNPSIIASIEPFGPGSDFKLLHISGGTFQVNEQVSLTIVVSSDKEPAQTFTQVASADAVGHLDYKYSGNGGGVCNPLSSIVHIRYSVTGTGVASHKVSNTIATGC